MARWALLWACAVAVASGLPVNAATPDAPVTNIVLVGAYGNLAGKYLWKALFSLYLDADRSDSPDVIKIYAAGRDAKEKGWPKVEAFLDAKLKCGPEHEKHNCKPEDITNFRAALGGIEYVQLKKDEHYGALCEAMSNGGAPERGRMFYLSVPPFSYAGLAKVIGEKCTPPSKDAFLRVAFEKPFGSDLASAEVMAAQLGEHLKEDQIYRVDHYLGKRGVQQILNYRLSTPKIDAMLNKDHVASVKVIMTETESCEGRTSFYDEYGVVRDVHQNHLTEVLTLLGMDLTDVADPSKALKAKADFLGAFEDARLEHAVLGQYDGYADHCKADRNDDTFVTGSPTFAAASLRVKSGRWAGVPFLIVAGKMLNERAASVEIQFKDLARPTGSVDGTTSPHARSRLVFHIQGGTPSRGPEVRVGFDVATHFLEQPHGAGENPDRDTFPGEGWEDVPFENLPAGVAEACSHIYSNGTAGKPDLPYDRLMSAMYTGAQDLFVGTGGLMQAWRLWDTLLAQSADSASAPPFIYTPGSSYREIVMQAAAANHRIHEDL